MSPMPRRSRLPDVDMMSGVGASPEIVRRQRQHPDHATDPVVGAAAMEEGAVAAIVLDHEQAHEKARGRHREQQARPIAEIEGYPHQKPERDQRPGCDDEFDDAACGVRSAIARQGLVSSGGHRAQQRSSGCLLVPVNLASDCQCVGWPMAQSRRSASLPRGARLNAGSIAAYCMAVSRLAQAWATLRSGEALPGNVAQPPFSM